MALLLISSLMPLYYPQCIGIISDIPYDFRRARAEVFASNQVRSRPIYSPLSLGVTGLPTKKSLLFLLIP